MSDIKLISPLLDQIDIGDPISDRCGVRACPAISRETETKYILKVISCPPSEAQLDALLLSGAYSSKEDAVAYFKDAADDIIKQAQTLQKLSALEGYLGFEGWQTDTREDGSGFNVYLLGQYRKTLERALSGQAITHLTALNLGLDLCTALSVCRQSGYIYVDLKPSNIYLDRDNSFKIGDIGFLPLNALKYTSLPDRCRSAYTAPEIQDAFSSVNTTVDIYALGLILYQVFNAGQLPVAQGGVIQPPDYADYEMAEIILKACALQPEDRYQDPGEFSQALIGYMQRNGAHDTPIIPPVIPVAEPVSEVSTEADVPTEESSEEIMPDIVAVVPEEITEAEDSAVYETSTDPAAEVSDASAHPDEEISQNITLTGDTDTVITSDTAVPVEEEKIVSAEPVDKASLQTDAPANEVASDETASADEESPIQIPEDETLPGEGEEDIDYTEITEEVSDILNMADELIAHPTPEGVVQPEAIDVPIPPPIMEEPAEEEIEDVECSDNESGTETDESTDDEDYSLDEEDAQPAPRHHWLRNILLAVCLLALIAGGVLFYKYYYVQTVDKLEIRGGEDSITAIVHSEIDEAILNVVCADTYGNKQVQPLQDGKAVFTGLAPNTAYSVRVEIEGFHKLQGEIIGAYATPKRTNIAQFHALTGAEDGSVILSFTVEGRDCEKWKIIYNTGNEPKKEEVFSGHMLTITGLTVGSEYTFTLLPDEDVSLTGTNTVTHTASKLVRAKNLEITSILDSKLTAVWENPDENTVESWTVHCYNERGFDKTIVATETTAVFEGITVGDPYTIEVTAAGMSVGERAFAEENAITVTSLTASAEVPTALTVSWSIGGTATNNNWKLQYTVDGAPMQELLVENATSAEIFPLIPGAVYHLLLLTENNEAVLGGKLTYTAAEARDFNNYGVSSTDMTFRMCLTPEYANWTRYSLSSSDYTTTFEVGQKGSFLVHLRGEYGVSREQVQILYVIRDEAGKLISAETDSNSWSSMWYHNYGEFDIPTMPSVAGNYTIQIYFDGAFAGSENFTVTE